MEPGLASSCVVWLNDISIYDIRLKRLAVATFGSEADNEIAPTIGILDEPKMTWTDSGQLLLIAAASGNRGVPRALAGATVPRSNWLWIARASGGAMRRFKSIPGQRIDDIFLSSSNGRVLLKTTDLIDYGTSWYALSDVTRGSTRLYHERSSMADPAFSRNRSRMVYYRQTASEPRDIWLTATEPFSPRRVTHLNPILDTYVFGSARLISWRTTDGLTLRGALMLPSGYVPGRRYPMVAYVYGSTYGSLNINNFGFGEYAVNTEDLQTLATRGIAILLLDAPVKTGTPMRDIAKTIMPGIDRAIALGYADSNRLGVMGHSNGGYSVMALIAQTNRFRAAISRAGFSDWVTLFSELLPDGTAYGIQVTHRDQSGLGGNPWQARDKFISQSPYYRFDRVTTPLLIIHGSADRIVVPFNGDMSFVALRHLHKDVAYAKYSGAGHAEGFWPFADQLDYMMRIVDWFDRYLCPNRKSEIEC